VKASEFFVSDSEFYLCPTDAIEGTYLLIFSLEVAESRSRFLSCLARHSGKVGKTGNSNEITD
jgi:hypothetical protein